MEKFLNQKVGFVIDCWVFISMFILWVQVNMECGDYLIFFNFFSESMTNYFLIIVKN